MKRCSVCKIEKPIELFCRNCRNKDGLNAKCRECSKHYKKQYQTKNKDKIKQKKHEDYLKNKESLKIYRKQYREKNKAKIKQRKYAYYLKNRESIIKKNSIYVKINRLQHNARGTKAKNKLKREVFSHYCGGEARCQECKQIDDLGLLTIDHINGGGNKHRREIGKRNCGGYKIYQWLKRNSYPEGFQVLCFNCQFKKKLKEIRPSNPTKIQMQTSAYCRSVKIQCLEHYGNICPCGETDQDILTLDHVNDDGAEHLRLLKKRGFNFYLYLRKNGFPNNPPLQVLCMNCNFRKRIQNEERKSGQAIDYKTTAVPV